MLLADNDKRRQADAKRFEELDGDLCMLCGAYGADKRSIFMSCLYAIYEVLPEAIQLWYVPGFEEVKHQYYLRVCKSCRGAWLGKLEEWRKDRMALRGQAKTHDGYLIDDEDEEGRNIPVRINGVVVMMDEIEYQEYMDSKGEF
jgi:hypothetical protein